MIVLIKAWNNTLNNFFLVFVHCRGQVWRDVLRMQQNMSSQNGSAAVSSQMVPNSTTFHHSYTKLRSKVIATAICTRLSVIFLAFLSDNFLPNHDADAFKWTPSSESGISSPTLIDKFTNLICDGLTTRYLVPIYS